MNRYVLLVAGLLTLTALQGCGDNGDSPDKPVTATPAAGENPAGQPLVSDTPDYLNGKDDKDDEAEDDGDHDTAAEAPDAGEEREIVSDQEEAPVEDAPAAKAGKQ